jgi:hypothetical protein
MKLYGSAPADESMEFAYSAMIAAAQQQDKPSEDAHG